MKKLLIIFGAVAIMGFVSSCKKCYTCDGNAVGVCSDTHTQDQIDLAKSSCEGGGGTWAQQ
jgi:hypothetical protein